MSEPDGQVQKPKGAPMISVLQQQVQRLTAEKRITETLLEQYARAHEKIVREIHEDATPIEVTVEVTNELTAKGDPKPSAKIRIGRKLAAGANVKEIIIADLKLGEEQTAIAIQNAVMVSAESNEEGEVVGRGGGK